MKINEETSKEETFSEASWGGLVRLYISKTSVSSFMVSESQSQFNTFAS